MKDWKKKYADKIVSAEEAVGHVKSGDKIVFTHACGEAQCLTQELVHQAERLEDVEIMHMVAMSTAPYCQPGMEKHFRHNALFVGGSTRKAVEEGRADYTPCFFHEAPKLFREGVLPVDVAFLQVSEPDENGNCSFGVSVDYTQPAAETAKMRIAQINKNMPYTYGNGIHLKDIDYIVLKDEPLIELQPPKIGETEKKIGGYVASLIHDGDTLQLGIGAIPDAVLTFLGDKKDLGIHSEMFSDGVVDLAEKGIITNKKKTIDQGKFLSCFLMGTKKLYDFVDHNPNVEMKPVDYTNDPFVVAQIDNIISINSAMQVDLMGQVNAEMIGPRQFSGVGGQVDFVRGASRARGGKAIIAMPSTTGKGKISKIVAYLDKGSAVTTSRNDVDYIITEYGIAALKGKTLRQRAAALIAIAHPDFRESLIAEFEKRFHCKFEE
ncbi:4-hydroxybutyrate CoA-transferase [Megasphaera cerevisiae DSM 20462]|uniref:4-hydroxybutyrate CoA-transferase n=1 Tax=Megasphaera cerevisiae DSM 20462 TaxID=1122219 RepID=A0A0J6ZRF1_9FIRM|nr:4-hydroxybutyrate CoA-transferase [Megasphaera cerevisiae DSM 20462]OKY54271.1 4-hydroxybutyrate CoA-transferase [Megasphaera cerevisiae]SJZ52486.1 4-hydroxybutyrate CoA-transferase [Megasphaera cerevisiae DSM 20462]